MSCDYIYIPLVNDERSGVVTNSLGNLCFSKMDTTDFNVQKDFCIS